MLMADRRYQLNGDLAGTIAGTTVTLRSTSLAYTMAEAPYFLCHFEWTGTINGPRITGTYRSVDCAQATIVGTFDVSPGSTTHLVSPAGAREGWIIAPQLARTVTG
jgi:hypothetical protein